MTGFLLLWAAGATCFTLVAWARLARVRRAAPDVAPLPVLLVRPADALTESERACLAAPIDYEPLEHVVVSPTGPDVAGLAWEASDPVTANRKVGHLLHALRSRNSQRRIASRARKS